VGFSEKKFLAMSHQKQEQNILKLFSKIEKFWNFEGRHIDLLNELQMCLSWLNYETPSNLQKLTYREFLTQIVPIEQKFGRNLKDDEIIILQKDGAKQPQNKIEITLILDNLRSAFNVGSIFRTAECFGISKIYLCGYTPNPTNQKVTKTAMGTENFVDWEKCDSTDKLIRQLKNENVQIYALETVESAKLISEADIREPAAIVIGNEALGISSKILQLADEIIQIPIFGWKNSLNVGVATAICCYEIRRK
jgi:23S rRNA (guanosine2251-2'-O)-methyltransferase